MAFVSARFLAAAVVTGGLLLAAGCGPGQQRIHPGDVVGAWHGTCGADLTFVAGGTASGHNVPWDGSPISGDAGIWRLAENIPGGPAQRVEFNLDGKHWDNLDIKGSGDKLALVLSIGDPDNGDSCEFRRT
jgi:hypothetical protein